MNSMEERLKNPEDNIESTVTDDSPLVIRSNAAYFGT